MAATTPETLVMAATEATRPAYTVSFKDGQLHVVFAKAERVIPFDRKKYQREYMRKYRKRKSGNQVSGQ